MSVNSIPCLFENSWISLHFWHLLTVVCVLQCSNRTLSCCVGWLISRLWHCLMTDRLTDQRPRHWTECDRKLCFTAVFTPKESTPGNALTQPINMKCIALVLLCISLILPTQAYKLIDIPVKWASVLCVDLALRIRNIFFYISQFDWLLNRGLEDQIQKYVLQKKVIEFTPPTGGTVVFRNHIHRHTPTTTHTHIHTDQHSSLWQPQDVPISAFPEHATNKQLMAMQMVWKVQHRELMTRSNTFQDTCVS